jgi:hypothetical protein
LDHSTNGGGSIPISNGFSDAYPVPGLTICISATSYSSTTSAEPFSPPSSIGKSGVENLTLIGSSMVYPLPGVSSSSLSIRPLLTPSRNMYAFAVAALANGEPKASAMGGVIVTVGSLVYV